MNEENKVHIHRLTQRPSRTRFNGLIPENMTPEQLSVHNNCLHAFTVMAGQYGFSLEKMAIETLKERFPGISEDKLVDAVSEVSAAKIGVPGTSVSSLLVQAIVLMATWDVLEELAAENEPRELPPNIAEILSQLPDITCSKDNCTKPGTYAILIPPPKDITDMPTPPGLEIAFAAFVSCSEHLSEWEKDKEKQPAMQIIPLKKENGS